MWNTIETCTEMVTEISSFVTSKYTFEKKGTSTFEFGKSRFLDWQIINGQLFISPPFFKGNKRKIRINRIKRWHVFAKMLKKRPWNLCRIE